jgi:23S rRNA pseudouridine2457 synthase
MPRLILLNKPYGVLCQFTSPDGRPTLADYVDRPGVYQQGASTRTARAWSF